MANPNFRGRPTGTTKNTFIEDPLLGDYKIIIDENSYNVVDKIKNKTLHYHTRLETAVLSIARKLMINSQVYSLEEYARAFKETHENLKEAILK